MSERRAVPEADTEEEQTACRQRLSLSLISGFRGVGRTHGSQLVTRTRMIALRVNMLLGVVWSENETGGYLLQLNCRA